MNFFDTHCHINFLAFENDWEDVVARSQKNNVNMLVVGTDLKTSLKAIAIARKYPNVRVALGLHPTHLKDRQWQSELAKFKKLIASEKVDAIGEIGFDDFCLRADEKTKQLKMQEKIVNDFLAIAFKKNKPVIFHARGAINLLEKKMRENPSNLKKVGAVVHCFSGDVSFARWLVRQGFYLGFNGMIIRKNDWDEIIKETLLENILLETDAPFLTPVKFGKTRNEPIFVREVAQRIAEIKSLSVEKVANQTFQNALKFLK
ncbi:MAG: TatD DNase family protein [Candidatus Berkelbacteria bacterium Licking1014_7]|uniref:TatD DNase family protein n=1 Tax=Candidatus Berkelbacteria bacterium Licking1014_7 TaxID=2017147 RepID=A0A554LIY9_9BACT|nr:MAG: TatD DNase family protein [Candidatus Berkelbacteria bacterium Licking1014_7]